MLKSLIFRRTFFLGILVLLIGLGAPGARATQLTNIQLGSPAGPGSYSYNSTTNVYTLTGTGAIDASGSSYSQGAFGDFAYTTVTGNFSFTANIATPTYWAGLLAMNSLNPEDMLAGVFVGSTNTSPDWGVEQVSSFDGAFSKTDYTYGSSFVWGNLTRSGNTFTESVSTNGSSWNVLTSENIPMLNTVYVGLFAGNGEFTGGTGNTGTFNNLSLTSVSQSSSNSVPAPNALGLFALLLAALMLIPRKDAGTEVRLV